MNDPGLQPFQCPTCSRRFTRRENLKRHATVHADSSKRETSLSCEYCDATFSRNDLRQRHVQRKHAGRGGKVCTRRLSNSSSYAERAAVQVRARHGRENEFAETGSGMSMTTTPMMVVDEVNETDEGMTDELTPGSYREDGDGEVRSIDGGGIAGSYDSSYGSQLSGPYSRSSDDKFSPTGPTNTQISTGVELFFTHVAPFLPFIHQATLNIASIPRYLLLSILCLGYQYGTDPDTPATPNSNTGTSLSRHYFDEARTLIYASPPGELEMVQSYLLLEVCAIMYLSGCTSPKGLEMHSRMIALARAKSLMYPSLEASGARNDEDLDAMWQSFVRAESQTRTLHAILQIDALWYQLLSVPRSVSHLEIKHDLPCPDPTWNASSAAAWAHRQLLAKDGVPPLSYADAVRRFISPEAQLQGQLQGVPAPMLDSYGAISVAQFFLSSMREVSGWSSITGRVSLDRFEPLKASVIALEPSIRPGDKELSGNTLLCEATWEMAMIELHLWSRSHTGGIVQSSLNDAIFQSAYQARTGDAFVLDADSVASCQPHIDWFIRYLQTSCTNPPPAEPPWVVMYAYRAFLIAWDLVRRGQPVSEVMAGVGMESGNEAGCLRWARSVFGKRLNKRLGEFMYESVDILDV